MTIGDVNNQEYCFQLVMSMDRGYCFGEVNEQVYFSDVNKLSEWQLVMLMNRSLILIGDVHELGVSFLSDVNEKVYFSYVNKLGKWQLVILMNRWFCFQLVMSMDKEYPWKWC